MRVSDEGVGKTIEERERSRWRRSVWRWRMGLLVALGYAILLHSTYLTEIEQLKDRFATTLLASCQAEASVQLQALIAEQRHVILADTDAQVVAMQRLLDRAAKLSWALQTPDVERDIALQTALEDLARRMP